MKKVTSLKVTSLDEIRKQAEPDIIEIPGFRPGTTINVAIRPVDLTTLLAAGIGNPLLALTKKRAEEGLSKEQIQAEVEGELAKDDGGRKIEAMLPMIDMVCKEALVEPTWAEIAGVVPLTTNQKLTIFNHVMGGSGGGADTFQSFRVQ